MAILDQWRSSLAYQALNRSTLVGGVYAMAIEFGAIVNIVLGALTRRTRGIIVNIAFGTIRYIVLSALTGRTRGIHIMAIEFGMIRYIVLGALANTVLGVLTGGTREHRVWPGHGAGDDHAMFSNIVLVVLYSPSKCATTQQVR